MTLLAAIGDISRFPDAKHLVGYSGLGSRVHDSGLTRRTGGMTKAGRRDIRAAMVEAAHAASRTHPHRKAELARLEPRLGHDEAIVAIARKLLLAVWHAPRVLHCEGTLVAGVAGVLAKGCADRLAVSWSTRPPHWPPVPRLTAEILTPDRPRFRYSISAPF